MVMVKQTLSYDHENTIARQTYLYSNSTKVITAVMTVLLR